MDGGAHPRRGARGGATYASSPTGRRGKVVIKAQVLVGGRGKAGGVKLAGSADEAERVAAEILALTIKGLPVRKVLVGPAADIVKEYYLSIVLDRGARKLLFIGSAEGGVEIEQTAESDPMRSRTSMPTRCSACPTISPGGWRSRSASAPTGRRPPRSPRACTGRCSRTTRTSSRSTRWP